MKQYIKSDSNTRYPRDVVIKELRKIPGIKIISIRDDCVVFRDHNGKEYSIGWDYEEPEEIDAFLDELKINSAGVSYVNPEDLSKERLETIVSTIIDVVDNPTIGSSQQLMKIIQTLEFYNLR